MQFEEIKMVEKLTRVRHELVKTHHLGDIESGSTSFSLHGVTIGSSAPEAPCFAIYAGVHGLENIGTHLVLNFINSVLERMKWDHHFCKLLEKCRIVTIPLVNPGGMAYRKRSNLNGVDLMRNSPVEANKNTTTFLVSGHRISKKLPWYRGKENDEMEKELKAVIDFTKAHVLNSKSAISIDCHSGFGLRDRLWYPFARSNERFPDIESVNKIKEILDKTHPHHVYLVEPQSDSYTINGDLWDHLYLISQKNFPKNRFIPWTLEMGSWNWVKKNPIQLFNIHGLFNPMKGHRYDRAMRRHFTLLEFLFRMTINLDKNLS